MTKIIWMGLVTVILCLSPGLALAECQTYTIWDKKGVMQICTSCCENGQCTVTCS